MTKPEARIRVPVSDNLLRLLEDASTHCGDFVDEIVNMSGTDEKYGSVDGRNVLFGILRSLVVLTGSEEAAVEWLFHSRGFKTAVGDDAYLALENGDFWSLALMQDWLHILETHRLACPVLIDAIFGPTK